jgi:hypothetical protein
MGAGNDLDVTYDTVFGKVRVYSEPEQPPLADWTVTDPRSGRVLGFITDTRDEAVMSGVPSSQNPVADDDEDPLKPFECHDGRGRYLNLAYQSVQGAATAIAGNAGLRRHRT